MSASVSTPGARSAPPRVTLAGIGLGTAPLAWAVHIGARYPLVDAACGAGGEGVLHAVSLVCGLVAAAGFACALAAVRRTREPPPTPRAPSSGAAREALVGTLARAGIVTSLVFFGSIVAEAVPTLVHDPCTRALLS